MNTLAKYHARAPRYILQPEDDTLIRVAGPHQIPWEEGTQIKNISLSGLAFTTTADLCPQVGEFIKIQFRLPGGKPMACYGLVTRLESKYDKTIVVGVHFQKLQTPHKMILLQSLSNRLREQMSQETSFVRESFAISVFRNWLKLSALWASLILWICSFAFMFFFKA